MKKARKSYIIIFALIVLVNNNQNTQAYIQQDTYIAAGSLEAASPNNSFMNATLPAVLAEKTGFIAELKGKRTVYVSKMMCVEYFLKGFANVNASLNGGIFAQEIEIIYDARLIDFIDTEVISTETAPIVKDTAKKGEIRLIIVNTGANKGINTDQTILRLYFKSKCYFKSSRISMKNVILADGNGTEYMPQRSDFTVTSLLTAGDLNGDGKVSIGDLMAVSGNYLKTLRFKGWESIMYADANEDSIIDIKDLAYIAIKL